MAHNFLNKLKRAKKDDTFLLYCGMGDMQYGFGVPLFIWKKNKESCGETCLVYTCQKENVPKFD